MAAAPAPIKGAIPAGEMHNGIPASYFVEDVATFMESKKMDAKALLEECDNIYQQYKRLEGSLATRQRKLQSQAVEIKANLGMLEHLDGMGADETLNTDFRLNDALFVKAKVPRTDKVGLWLGANVMLEYETSEALALLRKNFETATKNITEIAGDIDFLRDQITTVEVNMARIYNHDVTMRRKAKEGGQ